MGYHSCDGLVVAMGTPSLLVNGLALSQSILVELLNDSQAVS